MSSGSECAPPGGPPPPTAPTIALTRTPQGWSVISPAGRETVGDLVEGLSLADLVAEEFGPLSEPDRAARRSARGSGTVAGDDAVEAPIDARVAALERTVVQLEHALAARVSTERAIGVLAERHDTSARAAFDTLRQEARSQGRPVADLAREVLAGLRDDRLAPTDPAPSVVRQRAAPGDRPVPAQRPRAGSVDAAVASPVADGRS